MGVVLRNLQKVVPLRRARLRRDVDMLRHILGVQKFDLGIICVDNNRIQQINNIYRKKNVPTDVLSFPFYEVNMTACQPPASIQPNRRPPRISFSFFIVFTNLNSHNCMCVFLGPETW